MRTQQANDLLELTLVNARSNSPTTTASNERSTTVACSSSAAACGRRIHDTRRVQPTSKNSAVITPRPAITDSAISRCHARDVTRSRNSAVEVRP
jgi:hypothetical protein